MQIAPLLQHQTVLLSIWSFNIMHPTLAIFKNIIQNITVCKQLIVSANA